MYYFLKLKRKQNCIDLDSGYLSAGKARRKLDAQPAPKAEQARNRGLVQSCYFSGPAIWTSNMM